MFVVDEAGLDGRCGLKLWLAVHEKDGVNIFQRVVRQQTSGRYLNTGLAHLIVVYGHIAESVIFQYLPYFFDCDETLSEHEHLVFPDLQHG